MTLRHVVCQQTRCSSRSYVIVDAVHLVDEKPAAERRHDCGALGVVVDDLVVGVQKTLCSSPGSTWIAGDSVELRLDLVSA